MKQSASEQNHYREDEINLRELFNELELKKRFIIRTTVAITILAAIYIFNKTPMYEADALIEIGSYTPLSSDKQRALEPALDLARSLNVLFIDAVRNQKDRGFSIIDISAPKDYKNSNKVSKFIKVKAEAISNKLARTEVLKIISYIKNKHQKILHDLKDEYELAISSIDSEIYLIRNKKIKGLLEKIDIQQNQLNDYKLQLDIISDNIKNIEESNPTLTALKLMEKRDMRLFITKLNLHLIDLNNKVYKLETTTISNLLKKRKHIELLMLPHNYKNSEIVGHVITDEDPAGLNRIVIIMVVFVLALMFSVFSVFTINAFRK